LKRGDPGDPNRPILAHKCTFSISQVLQHTPPFQPKKPSLFCPFCSIQAHREKKKKQKKDIAFWSIAYFSPQVSYFNSRKKNFQASLPFTHIIKHDTKKQRRKLK
jgi:hypothetical protein